MEKTLKKTVLPPSSAVVITKKQFDWIYSVSSIADIFQTKTELSVVSKLSKKPIALVDVFSCTREPFKDNEKAFIRDAIKPKVDKIAASLVERSFKLVLKDRMLQENSISESDLFDHYPNIPQWVVLFNNASEDIEIELPEKFILPSVVSVSLV